MSTKNNGGNPNGCKVIGISETPPKMEELVRMVNRPSEIDPTTIFHKMRVQQLLEITTVAFM